MKPKVELWSLKSAKQKPKVELCDLKSAKQKTKVKLCSLKSAITTKSVIHSCRIKIKFAKNKKNQ